MVVRQLSPVILEKKKVFLKLVSDVGGLSYTYLTDNSVRLQIGKGL